MERTIVYTTEEKVSYSKFLSKVLLYLFFALLITAGVCALMAYLFLIHIRNQAAAGASEDEILRPIYITMIATGIAVLIMQFVSHIVMFRRREGSWIAYLIYAVLMGAFLSTFVIFLQPWVLAEALAVPAVIFLVMFLIGTFSKVNLGLLGLIGFGLLFGVLLTMGPMLLFGWLNPGVLAIYDYIVCVVMAVAMILFIGYDAYWMRRETEGRQLTRLDALYYSHRFYYDFIALFLRLLILLARSKR